MGDCIHSNFEDTGEVRMLPGCQKRAAKSIPQQVFHCLDCGIYFAGVARREVPAPPAAEHIIRSVKAGKLSKEDTARFGYLTADERAEIDGIEVCDHKGEVPIYVTFRCPTCGRIHQERAEVVGGKPE